LPRSPSWVFSLADFSSFFFVFLIFFLVQRLPSIHSRAHPLYDDLHEIQKKDLLGQGDGKWDGKGNEFEQFHVHILEQCFKSMPLFIKKSIYSTN